MRKSRTKKLRGSKRMKEQGYTQVSLWLDAKEKARMLSAARAKNKPLATWIREEINDVLDAREEDDDKQANNAHGG